MWNPKYPICVQLAPGANLEEHEGEKWEEHQGEEPGAEMTTTKQRSSKQTHDVPTTLYLFGRTGREKEEWFRHFLLASMDAEREKEMDQLKPGKCAFRSGMRKVTNALERSWLLYKHYIVCAL